MNDNTLAIDSEELRLKKSYEDDIREGESQRKQIGLKRDEKKLHKPNIFGEN